MCRAKGILFALVVCCGQYISNISSVFAQHDVQEQELAKSTGAWSGESELGFVATRGNTETQTINAKLKVVQLFTIWENTYTLEALNTAESGQTSSEKYLANAQANRRFNEYDFMFGLLTYEDDRFAGFDYESTASLGYGRRVLKTQASYLDLEIGPGVRFVKPDMEESDHEAILRLAAGYQYRFGENSVFDQEISIDGGEERVISRSITSLTSKINGYLAMRVSLTFKNNSEPADVDLEKTDTETAVTLVYGF